MHDHTIQAVNSDDKARPWTAMCHRKIWGFIQALLVSSPLSVMQAKHPGANDSASLSLPPRGNTWARHPNPQGGCRGQQRRYSGMASSWGSCFHLLF